jgi:hypothetical protein
MNLLIGITQVACSAFASFCRCPWNFVQIREELVQQPEAKWRFDGPHLVVHVSGKDEPQCLSFRSPRERISTKYLEVVAGPCKGYESQRWFIKIHKGQLGVLANDMPRPYFSIHSEAYPGKCLTKHTRSLKPHIMESAFGLIPYNPITPFEAVFLVDCNGCSKQSFFIDVPFLGIVKDIASTGIVRNFESFSNLTSTVQPFCSYTESFDTQCKSIFNKALFQRQVLD